MVLEGVAASWTELGSAVGGSVMPQLWLCSWSLLQEHHFCTVVYVWLQQPNRENNAFITIELETKLASHGI